ncbi:hypothetical protein D3C79_526970 [compost metagenome]
MEWNGMEWNGMEKLPHREGGAVKSLAAAWMPCRNGASLRRSAINRRWGRSPGSGDAKWIGRRAPYKKPDTVLASGLGLMGDLCKAPVIEVVDGLGYFQLRVHDEGTIADDGFIDGLPTEQQQDGILTGLDLDASTTGIQ